MSEQITALVQGTAPLTKAIEQAGSEINSARETIAKVGTNLEKTMKANAEASDRTTAALVKWTRQLVIATWVLGLLTGVLALVAVVQMFRGTVP